MTAPLFHITSKTEAQEAAHRGVYEPKLFSVEGFIHCSYARQVARVANIRFKGRRDLVLLQIDRSKLPSAVIDENLEGGTELFPHIYGRLPMSAVEKIHDFPCDETGQFDGIMDAWEKDSFS
jgi:uncharacterized protein (DUF952 family)